MKTIHAAFLFAVTAISVNASTIQLNSTATSINASESNSLGNNVVISKNPSWANPLTGSSWISYANTGDPFSAGYTSPANGTVVSFFQHFTLTQADLSTNGTISLYADDSAATVLNGITLMPEASMTGNTYSTCSDTKPNCTSVTTIVLPSQDLVAGINTLRFDVAQRNGSSFGLDYSGSVGAPSTTGGPTATPEPATWAATGAGVLALAVLRRRNRSQVRA